MQGGANACQTDADCTVGKNGRCSGGGHEMDHCTYDACMSDADCKSNETCACDSYGGNSCLASNCRNDGDCNGRGCSPTRAESCGNMGGPVGFYCHTSHDECTNDTECKDGDHTGLCVYQATVGHWACSFSMCVG
jgi:hypothetical protein